jgi:hypothetical protein
MAVIPEVKLFGKWSFEDIEVRSLLSTIVINCPENIYEEDLILYFKIPQNNWSRVRTW